MILWLCQLVTTRQSCLQYMSYPSECQPFSIYSVLTLTPIPILFLCQRQSRKELVRTAQSKVEWMCNSSVVTLEYVFVYRMNLCVMCLRTGIILYVQCTWECINVSTFWIYTTVLCACVDYAYLDFYIIHMHSNKLWMFVCMHVCTVWSQILVIHSGDYFILYQLYCKFNGPWCFRDGMVGI